MLRARDRAQGLEHESCFVGRFLGAGFEIGRDVGFGFEVVGRVVTGKCFSHAFHDSSS
jgi:hypothetical protein